MLRTPSRAPLATSALLVVSIATVAEPALARDFRVKDIPNGGVFKCLNCHTDNTGKSFTPFGLDAKSHLIGTDAISMRHTNWAAFCQRDSDKDGYTNGQELGDPNCTWVSGDPDPPGLVTNPGVKTSFPPPICGNGKLDPGEDCEGAMLTLSNCADIDAGDGVLACGDGCVYDTSGCSMPTSAASTTSGGDDSSGSTGGCAVDDGDTAPTVVAGAAALVLTASWARRRTKSSSELTK